MSLEENAKKREYQSAGWQISFNEDIRRLRDKILHNRDRIAVAQKALELLGG